MGARQRPHRRDQLVAHPGDEKSAKATDVVGDPECRVARPGELTGGVDQPLQHLVDRQLAATASTASDTARSAGLIGSCMAADDSLGASMPRLWYWTTVLIFVFVIAGIVIAITRLV